MTANERSSVTRRVRLPGGWTIPARFHWTGSVPVGRRSVELAVDVVVVAGQPRLAGCNIGASEPLRSSDLRKLRLEDVLDLATRAAAQPDQKLPGVRTVDFRAEEDAAGSAEAADDPTYPARQRYRAAAGPAETAIWRRVDAELLAEVVELYDKGGVPAVIAEIPATERTVRRWLARAREAGLR
jgi:hypothetical protein